MHARAAEGEVSFIWWLASSPRASRRMRHRLQDDDARALCCPEELTAEDLVASICLMAASTPALEVWRRELLSVVMHVAKSS